VPPLANSAAVIDAARAALPTDFLTRHIRFAEADRALPPTAPLPPGSRLSNEPAWVRIDKARLAARQLADRPHGRYQNTWNRDIFSTLIPHVQRPREVVGLLQWDAVSEASAGNVDIALTDCRAMVNAGRSLHDEPAAISQLVRIACGMVGVQTGRRVLALGQGSEKELKALAEALREEDAARIFALVARSERAAMHRVFTAAAAGDLPEMPAGTPPEEAEVYRRLPKGPPARTAHVWAVRHMNRLLEIESLPSHEQPAAIREWEETIKREAPPGAKDLLPSAVKIGGACRRYQASLRSAIAALAAERFRAAQGRWPESLTRLVPEYLTAVPLDPEDGQPLRFRRLPDGIVIYGVGTDGKDDGGAVLVTDPKDTPPDIGFRLWDADRRGKPADGP
jgi:hypothetical protein